MHKYAQILVKGRTEALCWHVTPQSRPQKCCTAVDYSRLDFSSTLSAAEYGPYLTGLMAKLNSQPKADITLLFLNFSVCVVSPLWWLNTCLNQWNIPLSLFLAPENKFSDQAVQMWINEHPTSTLSHHYPIRICRRKDIFFIVNCSQWWIKMCSEYCLAQ